MISAKLGCLWTVESFLDWILHEKIQTYKSCRNKFTKCEFKNVACLYTLHIQLKTQREQWMKQTIWQINTDKHRHRQACRQFYCVLPSLSNKCLVLFFSFYRFIYCYYYHQCIGPIDYTTSLKFAAALYKLDPCAILIEWMC